MKEQKKSSWGAAMVSFFKEYLFNFSGPGHLYYDENLTNEGKRKKNYIWRVLLPVSYTHLDVYKRQLIQTETGFPSPRVSTADTIGSIL